MRRAKLSVMVALALMLCVAGSVAAVSVSPVSNYNFSSGLSNWEVMYGDLGTFGLTHSGTTAGTSVHTAPWNGTLNPCLEWFRWEADQSQALAIGAKQTFGTAYDTANYVSVTLRADFYLKGQNWTTAQPPSGTEWVPAFMQVFYNRGATQLSAVRGIRDPAVPPVSGSTAVVWNPLLVTQTWDLYGSGIQQGDVITGIAFGGYGQSFAAQVDNIYLGGVTTQAPEPSGLVAVGTALSGAAFLVRRRRK